MLISLGAVVGCSAEMCQIEFVEGPTSHLALQYDGTGFQRGVGMVGTFTPTCDGKLAFYTGRTDKRIRWAAHRPDGRTGNLLLEAHLTCATLEQRSSGSTTYLVTSTPVSAGQQCQLYGQWSASWGYIWEASAATTGPLRTTGRVGYWADD